MPAARQLVSAAPASNLPGDKCHVLLVLPWLQWGVAFRLAGSIEQQQKTLQYLEWREKQYDKRVHVDIYTRCSTDNPAVRGALVYIATDGPQNVNWLGPAGLQDIAKQVAAAVGPSGPNYEYIFRLADAMRKVSIRYAKIYHSVVVLPLFTACVVALCPAP
jgi:cation transport regulator ChaC